MNTDIIVLDPIETPDADWCGPAVLSEKQPAHTGYPYALHVPMDVFNELFRDKVATVGFEGMVVNGVTPLFMRTDRKFFRVSFYYGDKQTATTVYDLLRAESKTVYKNWF